MSLKNLVNTRYAKKFGGDDHEVFVMSGSGKMMSFMNSSTFMMNRDVLNIVVKDIKEMTINVLDANGDANIIIDGEKVMAAVVKVERKDLDVAAASVMIGYIDEETLGYVAIGELKLDSLINGKDFKRNYDATYICFPAKTANFQSISVGYEFGVGGIYNIELQQQQLVRDLKYSKGVGVSGLVLRPNNVSLTLKYIPRSIQTDEYVNNKMVKESILTREDVKLFGQFYS